MVTETWPGSDVARVSVNGVLRRRKDFVTGAHFARSLTAEAQSTKALTDNQQAANKLMNRKLIAVTLAGALTLELLTACVPLPGRRNLSRRVVAGKVGDAVLVADDGATCAVPQNTFKRVQVGDTRTCIWQEGPPNTSTMGVGDPRLNGRRPVGRPGRPAALDGRP